MANVFPPRLPPVEPQRRRWFAGLLADPPWWIKRAPAELQEQQQSPLERRSQSFLFIVDALPWWVKRAPVELPLPELDEAPSRRMPWSAIAPATSDDLPWMHRPAACEPAAEEPMVQVRSCIATLLSGAPMELSPADVIRWMLIAMGQGTDPGSSLPWPIYCSKEPEAPDQVVTTYDTSWKSDGRDMHTGETFRHYGVQIRVRANDHAGGYAKANALRRALYGARRVRVDAGGGVYLVHSVSGMDVLAMGQDTPKSKRVLFTLNGTTAITMGVR